MPVHFLPRSLQKALGESRYERGMFYYLTCLGRWKCYLCIYLSICLFIYLASQQFIHTYIHTYTHTHIYIYIVINVRIQKKGFWNKTSSSRATTPHMKVLLGARCRVSAVNNRNGTVLAKRGWIQTLCSVAQNMRWRLREIEQQRHAHHWEDESN